MSKSLQSNGAALRRPGEEDDFCPVCKSSRYLNPDLRFLINPECYHKMCTSCVDRIFSSGPAPCPVAGCARTLRKHRFRQQTFDDIKVEREVNIRRGVAQVDKLNHQESDFTSLLSYNNYLELIEDLTFTLLENAKVATIEEATAEATAVAEAWDFLIPGLKYLEVDETETTREQPYDPFGGLVMQRNYYEPQDHIDHPWLDKARKDPKIMAGGYDFKEYYARTLLEAFAGLGCFIAEEKAARIEEGEGDGVSV